MEEGRPRRVSPDAGRLRSRFRARGSNRIQEGEPSERGREPTLLADRLRAAVPTPGSGVVLAARASVVDEILSAFELDEAQVTRRTLSQDERAVIDIALTDEPAAARSSGLLVDPSQGGPDRDPARSRRLRTTFRT
jgi:hypothetical protein